MPGPTRFAFIVGSPRSGTTILGDVLGIHQRMVKWHEPYFIWDWSVGNRENDVRGPQDASESHKRWVRRELEIYLKKSGMDTLIDKSPRNCLKVSFVHSIIPEAKFVHIIRDGRAATLSIRREWEKWKGYSEGNKLQGFSRLIRRMMGRQPYWRNRRQALLFELRNKTSLNPLKFFNRPKWGGRPGWGTRFPGWNEEMAKHSLLEFNALQWATAVKAIERDSHVVSPENWLEVRYEDLVLRPDPELRRVLDYLEVPVKNHDEMCAAFFQTSVDRWKQEFSNEELDAIRPILEPGMTQFGYSWDGSEPAEGSES